MTRAIRVTGAQRINAWLNKLAIPSTVHEISKFVGLFPQEFGAALFTMAASSLGARSGLSVDIRDKRQKLKSRLQITVSGFERIIAAYPPQQHILNLQDSEIYRL